MSTSAPDPFLMRADDPDFLFQIDASPEDEESLGGGICARVEGLRTSLPGLNPWIANNGESRLWVSIVLDLESRPRSNEGRLVLSITSPSIDFPVTSHDVRIQVPRDLVSRFPTGHSRSTFILLCLDRGVKKYCEWAGWNYPGKIPRTDEELSWAAEHGEPVLPDWMDELHLPKRRKPSTAAVEKALAGLSGSSVDERTDEFVEHVRSVRAATAASTVRGWWRLVDETSTDAHWEVAEQHMDDLGLSGDVFHDLRNYVALVAPEVARSGDVGRFGEVVAGIEDFEDVGDAGGLADRLSEVVDERELEVGDLPDLFEIRDS